MDPTIKKHPKPTPAATATATVAAAAAKTNTRHHHHLKAPPPIHPLPDPIPSSTTVQNISHRFSKLYANHKKFVSSSSKSDPHPQPDPHFQARNTSCATLMKSSSQHERISGHSNINLAVAKILEKDLFLSSKPKVKREKDDFKTPSSKKDPKRPSFEEFDVKKASQLMSKSLENIENVKGFHEVSENKRRTSVSSIPAPGRRRSLHGSQVELADFFSCTGVKVVAVDMPPFMQIHAVDCARKAHDSLEKFTSKTLALTLKKEFDGIYGPAWHCIVGTSFGSFVTHSVGGFMYFSMDQKLYILLFKTTVQRAEE